MKHTDFINDLKEAKKKKNRNLASLRQENKEKNFRGFSRREKYPQKIVELYEESSLH